jgi:hypothetical protein
LHRGGGGAQLLVNVKRLFCGESDPVTENSGKSPFIVDLPIKNGDFPLSITGWWFGT